MKKALLFTLLMALLMPWAANAQETLTVCDGSVSGTTTTTNDYVPIYGLYVDTQGQNSEFIIPAETEGMSDMVEGTISKLAFYITNSPATWGSPTVQVYMGEVEGTTLSSLNGPTNFTTVWTGTLSNQNATMEITLSTPYTYEGGNLLIGMYVQTASSAYKSTTFSGITAPSGSSRYNQGSGSGSAQSFLPKTTFTYEPAAAGDCEKPETCEVSDVTGTSATLTWSGGSGTYNVELKGGSYADWTAVLEGTNLTTTTLTLQPTTSYQARVQSVCTGSTPTSGWKTSASFTTPCDSYDIPYTYGFENAAPFDCWTVISGNVTVKNSSSNSHESSYYLDFRGTTSNMVALPQFANATNTLRVEFWTRPESTGGSSGKFAIGYMTDITDASSFVAVATYNSTEMTTSYVMKTVDFVNVPANANIAMRQFDCSTNYYWYVDDVTVKEMPSCVAPTGLAADAFTDAAELSWTANNGETAWTLYWKKAADANYTEVANATNPFTLNGLNAASVYQYYVVANCTADDASEPSEVFTFATECDVIAALGYSENFDSYTVASAITAPSARVLPSCWNTINTTTSSTYSVFPTVYYYSNTNYANSTPNCLKFYSLYSSYNSSYDPQPQYAILPEMTGLAGLQVTLMARGYNSSSTFKIGTMSDPTDATTFTMIAEQTLTTSYPTEAYEYIIPASCTDSYLAIMMDAANSSRTSNGVYIDDITISEVPTCPKPTGLAVTEVGKRTATLSWTENGEAEEWIIMVNNNTNYIFTNENPYTLTDLEPETQYKVQVSPVCDEESWSNEITFTTAIACPAPTGLATTSHGLNATFTWTAGTDTEWEVAFSDDATANPDENIDGTATEATYTKNDLALGDYYFWVRANCGDLDGYSEWAGPTSVHIGYCVPAPVSVDGNGISNVTFGMGDNIVNNDTPKATYADYTSQIGAVQAGVESTIAITYATGFDYGTIIWVDFDNSLSFEDSEIVYKGTSTSTNPTTLNATITIPTTQALGDYVMRIGGADSGFDSYISGSSTTVPSACYTGNWACFQDYTLRVLETPSCLTPTALAVNYTGGITAEVTWVGEAETYNIDVNGTVTEGVTSPYTLENLELDTAYEVKVQANCDDATSEWTNAVSFTTDLCLPENQCEITFELTDSYGDGWNGAYIEVLDVASGSSLAQMKNNNIAKGTETETYTLVVCDGREIQFVWHSGSYDSECSYIVTAFSGEEIFSGSGTMSEPVKYTVNCSPCFKPTDLQATHVGTESAVLNWEGTSASYVLQYRSAEQNINLAEWHQIGEDVTATATETTYTFDLSDYNGEGYVAIRHYNVTNMYFLDVDNITVTDPDGTTLVSADGSSIPSTWINQDVDADGYVWSTSLISGYFVSQSYDNDFGALTPDNWLIIPVSNLGGTLSFTAKGQDSSFPSEIFGVFVTTASSEDALAPVAAGSWSDEIATEEVSYQLTGLTANTPYEWQVKGLCGPDDESAWATAIFSTIELGTKNFVTEGSWTDADNWEPVGVPTIDDKVIISANATILPDVVATAKKITLNGGTLTVQDGGQLKQDGNVELIMEKEIAGYGTGNGNYYFIASPLTTTRLIYAQDWSFVNALTGNYDLYAFDPTQELEWVNYRGSSNHALFTSGNNNPVLVQQTGYLYAHEDYIKLQFVGSTAVKSNNNVLTEDFTYDNTSNDEFNGWALVGNPYTCDAYISYVDADGKALEADFYTLSTTNTYNLMSSSDALPPVTGALINYGATGKVQYATEAPEANASGKLNMTVTQNRGVVDQARIRFGNGANLGKMSFRNSSKLYMTQDNKDYAVVRAEAQGEMPVSFKAENNGTYTLSFSNENVEFSYLHLIDNLTGNDVDLLANPSYSFEAKTTDYASRFRLVFAQGNANSSDDFAFFSNGTLVINNEGNALMNVYDVTGRLINSQSINGSCQVSFNASTGVYMIQLVNDGNTKTQKIVVK